MDCSDDIVKEWFGQLPEGWSLRRLRTLGRFTSSGIDKKNVEGEPLVRMVNYTDVYGNFTLELRNSPDYMVVSCPANKVEEHGLVQGDMLFTPSSETPEDIGVSAVVMEYLTNTVYSYHITRFRLREKISLHYRKYLCNHPRVLRQFSRLCKGTTRQILVREDFKSAWVAIPPTEQQDRLAGYLDEQTAKIDRLMDMRRRQMVLLKEQRAALIQQAVTRGLNSNAPMKESGLPWLGEIPMHWQCSSLRRFWSVTDCKHLTVPFLDEGIPLASVSEVQSFELDLSQAKRTSEEFYRVLIEGERQPRLGDVIYCRNTSVGAAAYVSNDELLAMGQDVCLIRSAKQNGRYLVYQLRSAFMTEQLNTILVGATFKRINVSDIKALAIVCPSRNEQDAIVEFLDAQGAKTDHLISAYARQLELLTEYRAALIHECVTGQRTVPEAATT